MKRPRHRLYRRGKIWWLYWRHGGHTNRVSLGTQDESEALALAAQRMAAPRLVAAGEVEREVEAWLADRLAGGWFSAQSAAERRRVMLKTARDVPLESIASLTTPALLAWYRRRCAEVSPASADSQLAIVQSFCRWLVERKKLRDNPAKAVPRVRRAGVQRRERFADRATVDRLIEGAPGEALRFVLLAGFDAGLRRKEIVAVEWGWFDEAASRLSIPAAADKNRRGRTIPLTARFAAWVKAHRTGSGHVLAPEKVQGGAWRYRYDFRRPFADYMKAAGCEWITPHVMRHTFGSLRASAGRSIYKIAVWMGDSVRTVERHYAKLLPSDPDIDL